ncbi:transport integral membrane protein [Marmoricola endophyticus]|uniref:Transport integral membrane protein n=1 Tax=Marmoricola endophyticus TaxID=2040280 RepID=A0A917BEU4_9ACTN|nr:chloride channel protein [Marmoricola endophyticus]GGF38327.1 transport integral membrane protein [Marmoricola endophyticus]
MTSASESPEGRSLPVAIGPGSVGRWLRDSESGLLVLALLVGAGAGLGAVAFRYLISGFTKVLTGYDDYAGRGHAPHGFLPGVGPWFVLLTPVIAGILYGPLVYFFAREARGHGVPEVMVAVARRGGRIKPQVALVKALASALTIGGGGSVGREGPIVQIGSALGSTLGRLVRAPETRMRVLVACGAAGGIAATFNAPLAGVFFAMELILVDFAARSFGMVVLASVVASVIGRTVLGDDPFLVLPTFRVEHLVDYGFFAVLGVLAGVVGVVFTKVLYAIEDACDWAWRGPEWARPAVGGLLLGVVLLVLPQMYGVGYPVLGKGVAGDYAIGFLLVLMVGKMVATSLTIGIGGSGGVFAPSLFIGAMLGAAYGQVLGQVAPDLAGPVGAYALIGMGATFAGSARAPITAVVILFELTGEYSIILPLMAAIVLATGVSQVLSKDTIYTLKLRRRGIDLTAKQGTLDRPASALMQPVPTPVVETATIEEAATLLEQAADAVLPVVDADGRFRGVLSTRALTEVADTDEEGTVGDAVVQAPTVKAGDPARTAVELLEDPATEAVAVLDDEGAELVGWLTGRAVLAGLRRTPGP